MGGKTDQQNEAERLTNAYGDLNSQLNNEQGFNAFDDYNPKIGIGERRSSLDKLYGKQSGNLKLQTNNAVAREGNRVTSSNASRGITGGSVLDDAKSKSASKIYGQGFNAQANLGIGRQSQEVGMMDTENELDFKGENAGLMALLRKYGLMGGNLGGQSRLLGAYDNTTGLDDAFAGVGAVGNLAKGAIPLAKELWS